ncbi:hypothetical protein [Ferrimonas gelatinilytica]|uniref:Uncharacterized protein n=1 Tax=Ferrimonas gelatinilytica TaxID=1255257 RepID=A0ABP9RXA9_9GAMM
MLNILQTGTLLCGALLVLLAIITYLRRTHQWQALWQVWVGQLKDLNLTEFRLYRSGILLLFAGVLLRIINLTLNG